MVFLKRMVTVTYRIYNICICRIFVDILSWDMLDRSHNAGEDNTVDHANGDDGKGSNHF